MAGPRDHVRFRLTVVAIAASLSLLTGVAAGIGLGGYIWAQRQQSERFIPGLGDDPADPTSTPVVLGRCAERDCNYLLLGSDSREGLTKEEQRVFGSDEDIGGENRADTIILVHTEPDRKQAVIVHFPRDLWVEIPGQGMGKINGAFAGGIEGGGPRLIAETVKKLTGLPIHHVMYVDFAGFQGIVEALGGVPMCVDRPIDDPLTGLDIPKPGCYKFTPQQALAYVRTRHTGTECVPDFARIQRQQQFLRAVLNEMLSPSHIASLPELVPAVLESIRTDRGLNPAELAYLASQLQGVSTGAADFRAVPGIPKLIRPPEYPGGIAVVELLQPEADRLFDRLREDEPLGDLGKELSSTPPSPANIATGVFDRRSEGAARSVFLTLQRSGFDISPGLAGIDELDTTEKGSLILYAPGAQEKAKVVAHYATGLELVEAPKGFLHGMDVAVIVSSGYEPAPPGTGEVPELEGEC